MVRLGHFLLLVEVAVARIDYLTSKTSSSAIATETTTSFPSLTLLVWYTTFIDGSSSAYQAPYTQKFSQLWSTVQTVSPGHIGLGTINGSIGTVRMAQATPID